VNSFALPHAPCCDLWPHHSPETTGPSDLGRKPLKLWININPSFFTLIFSGKVTNTGSMLPLPQLA
jgi:hypothetical protein